jgi:hypothetical protein
MASSLFHINRQTPTAQGSGLPFMFFLQYQEQNAEITDSTPYGYWQTPQNRLPSFQVWSDYALTGFSIVPADGGTPLVLDPALLIETCTDPAKKIYHTPDEILDIILPCGLYYIQLDYGANPSMYSEVFLVGGVCAFGLGLVVNGVQDMGAGIQRVSFSITTNGQSGTTTFYTEAVTNWTTQSALDNLPFGDTNVTTEITTQYCGVFTQRYVYSNLGGTSYTFTPVY